MIAKTRQIPGTQFEEVPIDQIAPDPRNPRSDWSEKKLQKLAESMAREQVLQPVLVRKTPEGELPYQLVFGERRLRAAKLAGWGTIPARVVAGMSDAKALVLMGQENLMRDGWNPIELGQYVARLNAPKAEGGAGMRQREIAKLIGKSPTTVCYLIKTLRLPPEWKQKVASREISWSLAASLSRYAERPEVLKACLEDFHANPSDWGSAKGLLVLQSLVKAIAERVEGPQSAPEPPKRQNGRLHRLTDGAKECARIFKERQEEGEKVSMETVIQEYIAENGGSYHTLRRSLTDHPEETFVEKPPTPPPGTLRRTEALTLLKPYAENEQDLRLICEVAKDLLMVLARSAKAKPR